MKKQKPIITYLFLGIAFFSIFFLTRDVIAEEINSAVIPSYNNITTEFNEFILNENQVYNLEDLLNQSIASEEQKEEVTTAILQELQNQKFTPTYTRTVRAAKQTTVLKRLNSTQVQAIVNSNDPTSTLIGMIPLVGNIYSAISYFNMNQFRTAARNGWGMEYIITVDPNNPTSTGMAFAWRYVK